MKRNDKKWAGWVALTVIVVAAGIALAVTNSATQAPIADRNLLEAESALRALFPEADAGAAGFESIQPEESGGLRFSYRVKQSGNEIGYAVQTVTQGYGGPVAVITGIDASGALRGINVGGTDFAETEGLGAKAKDAEFTDQFKQKTPPLELGGDIDAISGATITSRAVVDGVNMGVAELSALTGSAAGQPEAAAARTASASVIGYGGPVLVRLSLDDQQQITSLVVGEARFMETEGLGALAREEGFTSQFVGKRPPVNMDDIDAISGATVTTKAVVDAVNEAYAFLNP